MAGGVGVREIFHCTLFYTLKLCECITTPKAKTNKKRKTKKKKIEKKPKKIEKSVKGGFLYQIVKHYETIIILKVRLCFKTRSIPRTA